MTSQSRDSRAPEFICMIFPIFFEGKLRTPLTITLNVQFSKLEKVVYKLCKLTFDEILHDGDTQSTDICANSAIVLVFFLIYSLKYSYMHTHPLVHFPFVHFIVAIAKETF